MVVDNLENAQVEDGEQTEKDPPQEDRTARRSNDADEDQPSADDELKGAKTDEEREAIRARRRQERQDRREKRRQHENDLHGLLATRDQQIAELSQQVTFLSRRSAGTELSQIDNELQQADSAVDELKDIIKEATAGQQGDVVADATDRMVRVHQRKQYLTNLRAAFIENANKRPQQGGQTQQRPSQEVVNHGSKWMSNHSWYNPQGVDMDSRIVRQIDDAVANEGYDPRTPDYWEELTERVTKYLPHKVVAQPSGNGQNGGAPDQRSGRRSVVAGSGREGTSAAASGASAGKSSFTLSPERVRALKEAGVWDDAQKRDDAIRRYRDYDKQRDADRR